MVMAMIARGYSKVNSTSPNPLSMVALEGKQELNLTGAALVFVGAMNLAGRGTAAPLFHDSIFN